MVAARTGLAVVTGGGSGIGRGCVELLAARDIDVIVVGRTATTLDDTVSAVTAQGGSARAVVADCATTAGRERSIHLTQTADDKITRQLVDIEFRPHGQYNERALRHGF